MTYDFVSCDYLLKMEPFLTDATEPLPPLIRINWTGSYPLHYYEAFPIPYYPGIISNVGLFLLLMARLVNTVNFKCQKYDKARVFCHVL